MKNSGSVYFIGCGVLGPDITHIAQKQGLLIKKKMLPGGLHEQPGELRKRLQAAIDEAAKDASCTRIIVGYGVCGKGTVGIHAPRVPLVFPKVHDCIALFMGSDRAYKEEFARFPGTYYISAGWSQEKETPEKNNSNRVWLGSRSMGWGEIKEKYGEKKGGDIIKFFSTWQKNYQRAAFIDTGIGKVGRYEKDARNIAKKYGWEYQRIKGSLSLMTRLLTSTETDDQILVVPPGYVTIYSAVDNGLAAALPTRAKGPAQSEQRFLVLGDNREDTAPSLRYGLGVDAGGTYTDTVIYDFKGMAVLGKNKALTTKWDFSIGIDKALSKLDENMLAKVELVSVSTTLATNAIVEGEGQTAGLILMSGKGNMPEGLITHTPRVHVKGQITIHGEQIEGIDPDEIRRVSRELIKQHNVTAFAVSGVAGAINPAHELAVKRILEAETGMLVTCGHELSSMLNFVVRAQTAVLNARIIPRMVKFFNELDTLLKEKGITAPVMVVKGDGTLMSARMARKRPVETILSGPAASVAGAKHLTGLTHAMVVDIGGTTTDTAELNEGLVEVTQSGAQVGGFATHVKALDMRTAGLGGDSLICRVKDKLQIGPRRVAPMVWAAAQFPDGVNHALNFMESRLKTNSSVTPLSQIVLLAVEGKFPFEPSKAETDLYRILRERPHAMEELPEKLNLMSLHFLPTKRLEESGLVQRCGLTPTDLLHINKSYKKWDSTAALRMLKIFSTLSRQDPETLLDYLLEQFEEKIAEEFLKKKLSREVDVDDEKNKTELSRYLIRSILSGGNPSFSLNIRLENPIIGIGAPVHYFLPNAGKKLNAEVVIPQDADVANAIGAITSHIMIKKDVSIRPDHVGCFMVDGIEGGKQFIDIDEAEAWAVKYLQKRMLQTARIAGTSRETVEMEIKDNIVTTGDGTYLFLDRTIEATLSGSPDLG